MIALQERHELEQYFFDRRTIADLSSLIRAHTSPLLLCAPTLARALAQEGRHVWALDIDDRFAALPGYTRWNIRRPTPVDFQPTLIFCDPPFFSVSLSDLFRAVRLLANFDFTTPIAISYLTRRARAIESVFSPFHLRATGYRPTYQTVKNIQRNDIQVFANFPCHLWPSSPAADDGMAELIRGGNGVSPREA